MEKVLPPHLKASIDSRKKEKDQKDNLILSFLEKYQGLTLSKLEEFLKKHFESFDEIPTDITKRSFLLNSLIRLEDEGKIYSQIEPDPIHGKIVRQYFKKFTDKDQTIITIQNDPMLKNLQENPFVYVRSFDEILISKEKWIKRNSEGVYLGPFEMEKIRDMSGRKRFRLPQEIIEFFKLDETNYYFEKSYKENQIILKKIKSLESKEVKPRKKIKNILVLEDSVRTTNKIKKKFSETPHKITYTNNETSFLKILKEKGKSFDIISMDNKINDVEIAEKLSSQVRYHAPNALVGLISNTVDNDILRLFQDLGYNFIIKKRESKDNDISDAMTYDEFIVWLEVV